MSLLELFVNDTACSFQNRNPQQKFNRMLVVSPLRVLAMLT